jgi:hypothetical protein
LRTDQGLPARNSPGAAYRIAAVQQHENWTESAA